MKDDKDVIMNDDIESEEEVKTKKTKVLNPTIIKPLEK